MAVTTITTVEAVIWTLANDPDQWFTQEDIAEDSGIPNHRSIGPYLRTLHHAGCIDRELVEGTGRWRYRWIGPGPGGVQ